MIEKVNPSHPDKVADRIAGAIVDLAYEKSEDAPKIAVEVLIGHENCTIICETSIKLNLNDIKKIVKRIVGKEVENVNYVEVPQDVELAKNQEGGVRTGDNGIFKGVPVNEEEKYLSSIARDLYSRYQCDGKYVFDEKTNTLIICQSNVNSLDLLRYVQAKYCDINLFKINPLGEWTGGINVDTGACISEDELVFTNRGLIKIKDIKIGDYVYTENNSAKVLNVIDKGYKDTNIIIDEFGGNIEATPDHLFKVFDGYNVLWKRCDELSQGDILLKRRLSHLLDAEHNKGIETFKYPIYASNGTHNKLYDKEIKIDNDFAYLMGWLVGDGNNTNDDRLVFYCGNEEEKNHLRPLLYKVFGDDMIKEYDCQKDRFTILSKGLVSTLINMGMHQGVAYNKEIPSFILERNNKIKGAFISGLFDADGYVRTGISEGRNSESISISFTTVSNKLVQQVKSLLFSMNIDSSVTKRNLKDKDIVICGKKVINVHDGYDLSIRGVYSKKRFIDDCEFKLPKKRYICEQYKLNKYTYSNRYIYDNDKYYLNTLIAKVLNLDSNKKWKYFPRFTNKKDINTVELNRGYKEKSIDYILDMYSEFKDNQDYTMLKYIYDNFKMVKIDRIEKGNSKVYDITVNDDTHSFITNGYIVHNCNRKLGSDMGRAITGGGLIGKDLSKSDVSINIMCHLLAQKTKCVVTTYCAIGDTDITFTFDDADKQQLVMTYKEVVDSAKNYVDSIGGFEKLAEWGLI